MLSTLHEMKFDLPFWIEARGDTFGDEDIRILSNLDAEISIGLESGSPQMLECMNKTNDSQGFLNDFEGLIYSCVTPKVPYIVNCMVGHPGETHETLNESIDYFHRILDKSRYGNIFLNIFNLFHGSPIYNNMSQYYEKYGTEIPYPEWHFYPTMENLLAYVEPSSEMSYKEVVDVTLERIIPIFEDSITRLQDVGDPKLNGQIRANQHFIGFVKDPLTQKYLYRGELIPPNLDEICNDFWRNFFNIPEILTHINRNREGLLILIPSLFSDIF